MSSEIVPAASASRPLCLWSDLLDEVFDLVLLKLPSSDVRNLRGVCRSWRSKTTRLLRELTPRYVQMSQVHLTS